MNRRRSWLIVPGHQQEMMLRASTRGADVIVLDLEDAVPPERKEEARTKTRNALGHSPAWVRINLARTHDAEEDLAAVADRAIGIRLPKTESRADVEWLAKRAPGQLIGCTIESAAGLSQAFEITSARIDHIVFGGEDFAADLNVPSNSPAVRQARTETLLRAKGGGVAAVIDGAYTSIGDTTGLLEDASEARALGFTGKSAIHPEQIVPIHVAFDFNEDEVQWAGEVIRTLRLSGGEATALPSTGQMIDKATLKRAEKIIAAKDTR